MSQSYPQAFVSFTPRKGPQSIHAGVEIMKIECPNIHSGAFEGVRCSWLQNRQFGRQAIEGEGSSDIVQEEHWERLPWPR